MFAVNLNATHRNTQNICIDFSYMQTRELLFTDEKQTELNQRNFNSLLCVYFFWFASSFSTQTSDTKQTDNPRFKQIDFHSKIKSTEGTEAAVVEKHSWSLQSSTGGRTPKNKLLNEELHKSWSILTQIHPRREICFIFCQYYSMNVTLDLSKSHQLSLMTSFGVKWAPECCRNAVQQPWRAQTQRHSIHKPARVTYHLQSSL